MTWSMFGRQASNWPRYQEHMPLSAVRRCHTCQAIVRYLLEGRRTGTLLSLPSYKSLVENVNLLRL